MTKNLMMCFEMLTQLQEASQEGDDALALITGPAGLGKTTSAAWLFVKADGVLVTCDDVDEEFSILRKLCKELGVAPKHGVAKTLELVKAEVTALGKPIFIDEADYIASKKKVLETIRSIHDAARVPILLIGYEKLPTKTKALPQFRSRIGGHVKLQNADKDDTKLMASLVEGVTIHDDLLDALLADTKGNFRDIRTGLKRIEKLALTNDVAEMTLAKWPADMDFYFKGI